MTLGAILLLVFIFALVAVWPVWPHSRRWGYLPGGGLGLILAVVLALMLTHRL
jgi:hypothetical protein